MEHSQPNMCASVVSGKRHTLAGRPLYPAWHELSTPTCSATDGIILGGIISDDPRSTWGRLSSGRDCLIRAASARRATIGPDDNNQRSRRVIIAFVERDQPFPPSNITSSPCQVTSRIAECTTIERRLTPHDRTRQACRWHTRLR
ncbi:hypothetical protein Q8F55_003612 [Vanrija albida]|uniref:Uncharacterized protein n=1 Tax=Vanrija albida TaxID=181172 RepID=A0ABR3Q4T1_9TREE